MHPGIPASLSLKRGNLATALGLKCMATLHQLWIQNLWSHAGPMFGRLQLVSYPQGFLQLSRPSSAEANRANSEAPWNAGPLQPTLRNAPRRLGCGPLFCPGPAQRFESSTVPLSRTVSPNVSMPATKMFLPLEADGVLICQHERF